MIKEIVAKIRTKGPELEEWIQGRQGVAPPPVTLSTDIRNAGFKISVVDTNIYPAGFNNLCETFSENASKAFARYFEKYHPEIKHIHIYPEAHTRNEFYQENLKALVRILSAAGFETTVGLELRRADLILMNNDLSSGYPEELKALSIPVIPSPLLGWHSRRKSIHFQIYGDLIREVAALLEIDPWLLTPLSTVESAIDLGSTTCLDRLQQSADQLLREIRIKYQQYGIRQEPYLFVKNNSGTYGLGVLPIDSGAELLQLSSRLRKKIEYAKGGRPVTELLFQEGLQTIDLYEGKPLEPVVYLVGGTPVGTFFRYHDERNERQNLNAPGMRFSCVCYHQTDHAEDLFTVCDLVARIASVAATLEMGYVPK
ncbi:MAG: glutamate--cysteine ligase [Deltaproteobacteria bacterium]|nr:glutamate--cysteine ligase [Deltaproteobacteria bacterium]